MKTQASHQKRGFVWWLRATLALAIILVVAAWSAGAVVKSNLLKSHPDPGQMVGVDGHKIHVYCTGEGSPTVILAAGLDDFSIFWSQIQPEVAGIALVDVAPDELFIRIPLWGNAIAGKLGLFRTLAPLSSFGLLAFTPEGIPNRRMPDEVLAEYCAIAVSTDYFQTGVAENEAFTPWHCL